MPLCPSSNLLLPDRYYTVVANAASRPTGAARLTGMMIYQVDVGLQYVWDGTEWIGVAGVTSCTEATRPGSPPLGLQIYETDTRRTLSWDGTGWIILAEPFQSYAPSSINITLGNGTLTGTYRRNDGMCDFMVKLAFGSTTSISLGPRFGLPVAPYYTDPLIMALGTLSDATGGQSSALIHMVTPSSPQIEPRRDGTQISGTVPFTWAVNDQIICYGRFRMTNRYS